MSLNTPQPIIKKSRKRWVAVAVLILAVIASAAWSVAWVKARDIVTQKFDGFLAREAEAGRIHECANKRVGGYPFLIEIACDAPVIRFNDAQGQMSASFSSLKTAALVYAPHHVIVEFGSPLVLSQGDKTLVSAAFKNAQASYKQSGNSFERVSVIANDLRVDTPLGLAAGHFEWHLRPSPVPAADAASNDYDVVIEADKFVTPASDPGQSMDASLSTTIRGWPHWQSSLARTSADWQRRDGTIEIQELRIKRNDGLFVAKGDVHFNDTRRAEGRLSATFVNAQELLRGLIMQGQNDAGAMFGPLFMMLGKKVDFEGKRATTMQLKVANGVVTLGSLVLGEVPPLY